MDYRVLDHKKELFQRVDREISLQKHEENFLVRYTHESVAMEGNTLTLAETKVVLIDGMAVAKPVADVEGVRDHSRAFLYVKKCIRKGEALNREVILNIARLLMDCPICKSLYRDENVYISGSAYEPPVRAQVPVLMEEYFRELEEKQQVCGMPEGIHPIELAAYTHAQFVHIHPFVDYNGRTARLLMNYQLMCSGFQPISIPGTRVLQYYNELERYHMTGEQDGFTKLIAELEEEELDKLIQ